MLEWPKEDQTVAFCTVARKHLPVPFTHDAGYGPGMQHDLAEMRRLALERVRNEQFGGNAQALADAIDRDGNQVRQWLRGHRNIGEKLARHIEAKLGMVRGELDRAGEPPPVTLSADESALVARYRVASPAGRMAILQFASLTEPQRDSMGQHLLSVVFGPAVDDARIPASFQSPAAKRAKR